MVTPRHAIGLILLLLMFGCRTLPDKDIEAQRLLDTDKAFSDSSVTLGMAEAFYRFMDKEGMLLPPGGVPVVGPEAARSGLMSAGDVLLQWTPRKAEVSESGDLGWTWGRYEFRSRTDSSLIEKGTYLDVWRKQDDGSWKVLVDMGNEDP